MGADNYSANRQWLFIGKIKKSDIRNIKIFAAIQNLFNRYAWKRHIWLLGVKCL